ncbi:MAG: LytTR family DNA-binding domain-containing protein [Lachnospiraceae bacterium]|nr:LytTR family DNA-binding domain-containing protein [Lachnospiraceae bacterium]
MLHILICEDNEVHRTRMETIVNRYLFSDDFDMKFALSVDRPDMLLAYLETYQNQNGLYFLDIDLQSEMNGIELAAKIREKDVSATIVFVTTHSEMMHYVFRFKIEAMDFIVKDDSLENIEQRMIECMQTAYQRFLDGKRGMVKYFTVKVGNQKLNIPYDDILFFEPSINQRNKIILHRVNSTLEFYGTINDVSDFGLPFYKCHQSFVLNVNHVKCVDTINRTAEMIDGSTIAIARRKMTEFLKYIK